MKVLRLKKKLFHDEMKLYRLVYPSFALFVQSCNSSKGKFFFD